MNGVTGTKFEGRTDVLVDLVGYKISVARLQR